MRLEPPAAADRGMRILSLVTGALLAVLLVARPDIALDRWGVADGFLAYDPGADIRTRL